ncbi:transmembrane protein [Ophiostoma piceae UAMH 11346]|uniref:Putative transcription factor kapC n=1 Tax=Ophiostoma piceae (strain UAMH 11346) TaxID=1262450 RepID=S3BMU1_OPHP1|nr:transmembrane protein [Ophiostoma piceae UAMH 11346]
MSTVAQPQPPATPNGAASGLDTNMTPGSPGSQDESSIITDGRRGPRRELSTSKRAAQNRAAQRAFRQRKEGYIKKLEQQVQEFGEMENQFKNLQSENFTLREYVIHLQSKIIDLKADMPQPPPTLNLSSVGLGHNLSGASAAAAAASLLSNAANAAALQRQQEQEQHATAAAAAIAASGYTPGRRPIYAERKR